MKRLCQTVCFLVIVIAIILISFKYYHIFLSETSLVDAYERGMHYGPTEGKIYKLKPKTKGTDEVILIRKAKKGGLTAVRAKKIKNRLWMQLPSEFNGFYQMPMQLNFMNFGDDFPIIAATDNPEIVTAEVREKGGSFSERLFTSEKSKRGIFILSCFNNDKYINEKIKDISEYMVVGYDSNNFFVGDSLSETVAERPDSFMKFPVDFSLFDTIPDGNIPYITIEHLKNLFCDTITDEDGNISYSENGLMPFFAQTYQDPTEIKLSTFVNSFHPKRSELTEQEKILIEESAEWKNSDKYKGYTVDSYPYYTLIVYGKDIDEALMEYAGITRENIVRDKVNYIEELDAYWINSYTNGSGCFYCDLGEKKR